jgi:hypothetical protein
MRGRHWGAFIKVLYSIIFKTLLYRFAELLIAFIERALHFLTRMGDFVRMKLKYISMVVAAALLTGCSSSSRSNNNSAKASEEAKNEASKPVDFQAYATLNTDKTLYIDFDSGDAGISTGDANNFDISFSERGAIALGKNAELYRTKTIKFNGDLDSLKTAHEADKSLNEAEFKAFTIEAPLERLEDKDLPLINNVGNSDAEAGNWAVYAGPPSHKLYSRLALYVIKTDNDNYFVIQPLAQLPSGRGMSPFTSNIRIKKINKPTGLGE